MIITIARVIRAIFINDSGLVVVVVIDILNSINWQTVNKRVILTEDIPLVKTN